ncbi:MAG: hypothetical protein LBB26_01295 [Puniceicoccales bacterium]|jgi:hypothetical protein|nr:hypothetical protein [Puniceicoccales bacterium]
MSANGIHGQSGVQTYVISDPESGRQFTCDVPTEVALAADFSSRAIPTDEDMGGEDGAKRRLVRTMILYPECGDFIRGMFWSLIDRGENIICELQNSEL